MRQLKGADTGAGAAVSGVYSLQDGGYDAGTNTPDLDVAPTLIEKGFAFPVTAGGTFFTEVVSIGDTLIALQDNPTALVHWIIHEENLNQATETQYGYAEIATAAEVTTGTDDLKIVTPLKLANAISSFGDNPLSSNLDILAFIIKSSTGDVNLDSADTAGGNVVAKPNATGKFIVRKDGGVPGTDDVEVYADATDGYINYARTGGELRLAHLGVIGLTIGAPEIRIFKNINPRTGLTYDLGKDSKRFRDIYSRVLKPLACSTSFPSAEFPHGTAPTVPVDGAMWTTTTGLFVQINGATVGPLS